jgi:hypothetical protein
VNLLRLRAQNCERLFHLCLEASGPADVDLGVWRDAGFVENRSREVTGSVEILTILSRGPGLL